MNIDWVKGTEPGLPQIARLPSEADVLNISVYSGYDVHIMKCDGSRETIRMAYSREIWRRGRK